MRILKSILLPEICLLILINTTAFGQSFFRIECDISIKTKTVGGSGQLTLGKVYYDKNIQKLVYCIHFPENEVWVVKDSVAYTFKNNLLYQKDKINPFVQTTVFHKSLEGKFNDYGLKGSIYSIEKVEKDSNMVITTWKPPSNAMYLGKIITSTVNNNLYGVVIKNKVDVIVSKQVYKKYSVFKGIKFPTEIIQVMYKGTQEVYQVITLSNVIVNSLQNENYYNYPINH